MARQIVRGSAQTGKPQNDFGMRAGAHPKESVKLRRKAGDRRSLGKSLS